MKKAVFALTFCGMILFSLPGCNSVEAPEVTQLMEKINGAYCADGYRLEIKPDTTYYNFRVQTGLMGPMTEICRGTYAFRYEEDKKEWYIDFEKNRDRSKTLAPCSGNILIWTAKDGYVVGDSVVSLPELFDQQEVVKGSCDIVL